MVRLLQVVIMKKVRAHIIDSHIGLIAIGTRSASVIRPDGVLCDVMATALMVDGLDAQTWIRRPELTGYFFDNQSPRWNSVVVWIE